MSLKKDIADLKDPTVVEVDHHKEESPTIINTDHGDRNAIRDTLDACVYPFDVSQGHNNISIVTGKMSMLKTLFRLEKPICKNSSRLV